MALLNCLDSYNVCSKLFITHFVIKGNETNFDTTLSELFYNNAQKSNDSIVTRIRPWSLGMSWVQVLNQSETFESTVFFFVFYQFLFCCFL